MSGQPSGKLIEAMAHVQAGTKTPYAAARDANIALSTMYRSQLYKAWKAAQEAPPEKKKK